MKKILYIVITVIFTLLFPFLILLAFIPILLFGVYLWAWDSRTKEKRKNWTKENIEKDWMEVRRREVGPIFKSILPQDIDSALDIGP
ncbi:MAG: hypothetical protein ABIA56_00930, partial [Actinomycetota bacterium]